MIFYKMRCANLFLSLAITSCLISCSTPKDSIDKKVDDLLSKMTLREKIGQMNQLSGGASLCEQAAKGEIGSILNCVDPKEINQVQRAAVQQSRLGIPILVSRDVIHGFHTIMPIPLGQAATFNPDLVQKGARVSAIEASASGIRWTFSPMLDISRDPRWGRCAEGSGEDPLLATLMGTAMVKGYQGEQFDSTSIAACAKHFVGYGAAEGGRDYNTSPIPIRSLRNTYLPAFKACAEAGSMSFMTSFNDIDGVPSTGNSWLIRDVLREEWGYKGFVVSDWNSVGEMVAHGYASDLKHASELAVNAGVEMDMMSYGYISFVEQLVSEGKVSQESIDDAVRNILRVKFQLGLFDNPYVDETLSSKVDYCPEHLEISKQLALESAILLKNDESALPLTDAKTILVTGPLADAPYEQLGTWTFDGQSEHTVTPLEALKMQYNVIYVPGLDYSRDKSKAQFSKVIKAAASVDACIVFLGEEAILSGEAHCLSNLNLQGDQSQLLSELYKTGKKVIAVVMAGRPLTIERDLANCNAMLYSFHPGTMGGEAIADLISGKAVPSGKVPMTFLRDAGQAPFYYNHPNTGRPCSGTEVLLDDIPLQAGQTSLGCTSFYLDSGFGPLFPFGYGLSYTSFKYSNIKLNKTEYTKDETIVVEFDLSNTGKYDACEVAQLYVRDLVGSIVRPVKELKRFERISLKAGESKHIKMELPINELAFWNKDLKYGVEAGEFQLWVAGDSASGESLAFKIVD